MSSAVLFKAFKMQKNSAKYRGLDWLLTFDEWLNIWTESGRLSDRGFGAGKFVMARIGDKGGYVKGNVEIIPFEKNASDARKNHPVSNYERRSKQIGSGRGWTFCAGKFQVTVSKKYVGRFNTQEEAETAYKFHSSRMLELSSKCILTDNPVVLESKKQ